MTLEELKKLAEAATPGPWIEAGNGGDNLNAEAKAQQRAKRIETETKFQSC